MSTPTVPSAPAGLASGTPLTFVSGETGAPVSGVTVSVGGQGQTTDAAGQVRLASTVAFGSAIDIVHPDYLDRLSTLRAGSGSRFSLWPRTSRDGLTEHYTAKLVYTDATEDSVVGDAPMYRLARGTNTVVVVPSPELLADGPAMDAHYAAVASINQATRGAVTYALAPTRPSGGIVVTTRVDPQDESCLNERIRGYTQSSGSVLELTGAEIVLCELDVARSATVAHELGHTFGLGHAPDPGDVMYFQFGRNRATTFGPRESLVMRLMLDRPAGNRFPDNDRGALVVTSSVQKRVIVCY